MAEGERTAASFASTRLHCLRELALKGASPVQSERSAGVERGVTRADEFCPETGLLGFGGVGISVHGSIAVCRCCGLEFAKDIAFIRNESILLHFCHSLEGLNKTHVSVRSCVYQKRDLDVLCCLKVGVLSFLVVGICRTCFT